MIFEMTIQQMEEGAGAGLIERQVTEQELIATTKDEMET
jgi:hypothetical protein